MIFFPMLIARLPPSVASSDKNERDRPLGKLDLECVMSLRAIAGSNSAAAACAKFSGVGALPSQGLFRDRGAPRFVRHAAKREANVANHSVLRPQSAAATETRQRHNSRGPALCDRRNEVRKTTPGDQSR